MYSQLVIAPQLPQVDNALNFQKCLIAGNWLMVLSLIIVTSCIAITFVFDRHFYIAALVSAHIATVVFAGLFKLGFVLRCIALHGLGNERF